MPKFIPYKSKIEHREEESILSIPRGQSKKPVRNKWGSKKKIEQMNLDRELKKPFLPEYVDPKWEKKLKVEN